MSTIDVTKLKDPFVSLETLPWPDYEDPSFEYDCPLRRMFEEIAPPLVQKPKAPRTPLAPIRTNTWDPSQGMKGAKYPTFVPLPLPGTTPVTTAQAPISRGKHGLNTLVNLVVDVSGSMGAGASTWKGHNFKRWQIARIVAAIMVKQCQLGDDAFAIYEFNSYGHTLWKGPSYDYVDCMDYLTSCGNETPILGPNGTITAYPPFYPRGSTSIASGLRECIRGMQGQKLDKAVTIVITDEVSNEGQNIWNAAFSGAPNSDKSCDELLRSYGPVFYIGIGAWNDKQRGEQAMKNLSKNFDNYYGKKNYAICIFESINPNNNNSTMALAGNLVKMAQMTK